MWSPMNTLTGTPCLPARRETLFKLAEGKTDPVLAFTIGKLKVEGNIDKALRLKDLIDSRMK